MAAFLFDTIILVETSIKNEDMNMHTSMPREKLLPLATYASISVAAILILLKTWVWLASGSASILASLLDSIMDSFASIINLFAIRIAIQPADNNHRFGHGKAEGLSALAQSTFIAGSAVFLILHSVDQLIKPQAVAHTGWGMVVMVVSMVLTFALVMFQRWILKQTESQSVHADSMHYVTDFMANGVVIVALLLTQLGFASADAVLAITLGVWILKSSWDIAKEAFDTLMDKALSDEENQTIQTVVLQTEGVLGMHDLRTRASGAVKFIQFHIEVADDLNIVAAHAISEEVEHRVMALYADAEVIVHQDPSCVVSSSKNQEQQTQT